MRRPGKVFAVLFIASGAAFLGLLTGGEHRPVGAAEDPLAHFWPAPMPRYPGANERPIAADQKVGQSGLKMTYFSTTDSPAQVGDFYAGEWRRAGFYVTEDVTLQGGSVSGYDVALGMMRQIVMLVRNGRTLVFPAVATSPVKMLDASAAPPEVPIYPRASGLLVTGARDPLARSQSVSYLDEGPLEANLTFYRAEMARRGWTDETRQSSSKQIGEDVRILVYTRNGAECTVNFLKIDEARTRVLVTLVKS